MYIHVKCKTCLEQKHIEWKHGYVNCNGVQFPVKHFLVKLILDICSEAHESLP